MSDGEDNSFQPIFKEHWVVQTLSPSSIPFRDAKSGYSEISIDSRSLTKNSLFVPIQGERFDGHDYIVHAIENGATGALCESKHQEEICEKLKKQNLSCSLYVVENALEAFRLLAQNWRQQFSIPVICIAGSVGKTTTKELLAKILETHFSGNVLKTQGSQNGDVGIPLTLLQLRNTHRCAVIEVGIDTPGAMTSHMQVLSPTHSVLTAICEEHLETMKDLETVIREEQIALTSLNSSKGTAFVHLDDLHIRNVLPALTETKNITFGFQDSNADYHGEYQGTYIQVSSDKFDLPLLGRHNANNLLASITIARSLNVPVQQIQNALESFSGIFGRSRIENGPNRSIVICDYYNALPSAMEAALHFLRETWETRGEEGEMWVALGDMRELGKNEVQFHENLAQVIDRLEVHNICLHGSLMKFLNKKLKENSNQKRLHHFDNKQEMAEYLVQNLSENDCLLIKGSRGMQMEEVWEAICS